MSIFFYNTLSRRKEAFTPINEKNVRIYVCGPTVYDRPHLGNARSVVVYDVLYRLLTHVYGKDHVTYVRNITDVDDKINARAKERGISIRALTEEVTAQFHEDMDALNCLRPTIEPRANDHISDMHHIIQQLLDNKHAYVSQRHVLFDVASVPHYSASMGNDVQGFVYGMLSHRIQDDLVAGARVEVESYKKNAGDFVLWKPAEAGDDASSVFDSPWGAGRPGWHIECSAMSSKHLGDTFDLHGGGADLMFPHHENEIAQSRCANKQAEFARMWVHNGFLTVGGEKMSKSLGNFTTVRDLLDKGVKGEVIRLALLMAKYNEPLDWNEKLVADAKTTLDKWYRTIKPTEEKLAHALWNSFIDALCDDLNTPKAFSFMHQANPQELYAMGRLYGLFGMTTEQWFKGNDTGAGTQHIELLVNNRIAAKKAKNWAEADKIRKELADQGIILEDRPDGTTDWRKA
jgi:cysteinyl-tRNA synthetase